MISHIFLFCSPLLVPLPRCSRILPFALVPLVITFTTLNHKILLSYLVYQLLNPIYQSLGIILLNPKPFPSHFNSPNLISFKLFVIRLVINFVALSNMFSTLLSWTIAYDSFYHERMLHFVKYFFSIF